MIKTYLHTGYMSATQKHAIVTPLLRKPADRVEE